MTYLIAAKRSNPGAWQVIETRPNLPEEIVAECGDERRAQHIRDLLNDCTITMANQLATLRGNFTRMIADRDAAYERLNAALDRLETMRKQLGEVRTERDTLLKERDAAQAEGGSRARLIYERAAATSQLEYTRKELADLRKDWNELAAKLALEQQERGKLAEQRDRLRILLDAARSQVNDLSSRLQGAQGEPQNGSDDQGESVTITGLTEALNTAACCVVLHPDARSAFNLLAKAYRSPGK